MDCYLAPRPIKLPRSVAYATSLHRCVCLSIEGYLNSQRECNFYRSNSDTYWVLRAAFLRHHWQLMVWQKVFGCENPVKQNHYYLDWLQLLHLCTTVSSPASRSIPKVMVILLFPLICRPTRTQPNCLCTYYYILAECACGSPPRWRGGSSCRGGSTRYGIPPVLFLVASEFRNAISRLRPLRLGTQ